MNYSLNINKHNTELILSAIDKLIREHKSIKFSKIENISYVKLIDYWHDQSNDSFIELYFRVLINLLQIFGYNFYNQESKGTK